MELIINDKDHRVIKEKLAIYFVFAVFPLFSFHFFRYKFWKKRGFTLKDYCFSYHKFFERIEDDFYTYKQIVFFGFGLDWFKKV